MRRPTSPSPLPLAIRNPQNDATKYDSDGAGPCIVLAFGPRDYYWLYEGQQTGTNPLLISILTATSSTPHQPTVVNTSQLVAPNVSPNWEQSEISASTIFWVFSAQKFYAYYHGGNNAGPRQVGLLTAPAVAGKPGTWTRYSSSPVMPNGGVGWRQNGVADAKVVPPSTFHNDWRTISRGWNGANVSSLGLWTSSDGLTWTDYASNPVITGNGSGNENTIDTTGAMYEDELGRFHLWYCAADAGGTIRTFYAFSDDSGQTWTRDATDIQLAGTGVVADPDRQVPDSLGWLDDSGFLYHYCANFNIDSYPDGIGRLAGRGMYWHPKIAATQPIRPGRAFVNYSANQRVTINSAATLMNSTVFTAWMEFRCPPGSQHRDFYTEWNAFNRQLFVKVDNLGIVWAFFRTTAAIVQITSASRYDDGQLHRVLFVRRAASDWEAYVDGVSIGTSANSPGTDAGTFTICCGNWDPAAGVDEPMMGLLRQTVTIQGRALTLAEEATLYNGGLDGGTLPAGVTATVWIKHGSGGQAGPDTAQNGATYGSTVTAGTYLVKAEQTLAGGGDGQPTIYRIQMA